MSQPTIWTDPAKFFREDQKLKYEAAQSDASRPNIYASGESSFSCGSFKLNNDLSKKPTPEPTPVVAEEVDPEAAEAKNQEIVQAPGSGRGGGRGGIGCCGRRRGRGGHRDRHGGGRRAGDGRVVGGGRREAGRVR